MEKSTNPKCRYEIVYWSFLIDFNLSPLDFLTLFLIYGLSKKDGYCSASKKYLSKILNVSPPSIFKSIKCLLAKGFIIKNGYTTKGVLRLKPTEKFLNYLNYVSQEKQKKDTI